MAKNLVRGEQLNKMFEDDRVMLKTRVEVSVNVRPSDMIRELANALLSEVLRLSNYSSEFDGFDVNQMTKYLNTLLWLRVNKVNSIDSGATRGYKTMYRYYAVPVLFYHVLMNVGIATDTDYNIVFIPEYNPQEDDILSPEEMNSVSDMLFRFPDMHNIEGMPKNPSGSVEFMALQHVNKKVTGYQTNVHPVNAFLASFISQLEYNEVTGSMHRIVYGVDADYRLRVSSAVRAVVRSGENRLSSGDLDQDE